jgi:hypothetical protein
MKRILLIEEEVDGCHNCLCCINDEGYGAYCGHPAVLDMPIIIYEPVIPFPDFCPLKEIDQK